MNVPYIRWVNEDEATGEVAEIYRKWLDANPERDGMPEILKCFSPRPDMLSAIMRVTYSVHFCDGFLTRKQKEMIATLVSGLNQCEY